LLRRPEPDEVWRAPDSPGARPSVEREAYDQALRFNQAKYRRSALPPETERDYSISCALGGFGQVGIPWSGTSYENARDSFLIYLYEDDEFNDTGGRYPDYRSLYVRFNGQWRLLTFRTTWITGFTVH
jgi:hypothetical protein